ATLHEARALARVAHPSVVAIHQVGDLDGLVYIVMERLRGHDLRSWQRWRAWPEVVRMYVELARGLGCAHRQGVVHRDFKPENVLVDEHGRGRILDFGLAGALDAEASGGTPAYVAPEQLTGASADPRMDQFAWAVALIEALTSERPRAGTMPELPTGPDAPPSRVWAVLTRALQLEPDARWASLETLADALERAANSTAEQRGRELLLDKLEATWLAGMLRPLRRERVALHPTIVRQSSSTRSVVELQAIDRALAHGGLVVVLGGPGSGKTTTLLEFAELALARARRDASALLPVVLNLSSWSTWLGDSMADWLVDALSIEYGITNAVARRWLQDDALLLLLDGLDEVAAARRSGCVAAIAALRAEHLVGVALACRNTERVPELHATLTVELQPLSAEEVHAALERVRLAALLERSPDLAGLLTTPLLVDMTLRCVGEPGPELATIPEARLLRALLLRWIDRQLTPLAPERRAWLHTRLARLARLLERQGVSELWLERMQPSWLEHPRVHRVATFVVVALLFASVVASTLIPAAGVRVGLGSAALVGPVLALFVGRSAGLKRIEPVERLTWSWSRLRTNLRRVPPRAFGLAAIVSAIAALVWGSGQSPAFAFAIAISNLLGYSLLFGLMLGVLEGLGAELVATRSRVNEGMHASARNTLLVWGLVACMLAIPLLGLGWAARTMAAPELASEATAVWQAAPSRFFALVGVCAASTLGLVAAMLRGGFAVVQHAVLRVLLAIAGELPLRVSRLLEAGCARSLLRRVGGGHAFIHAALQAELARGSSLD
ncbi:MAG TPA: protein kinase, partial [Enhygromyxa sp.]|nr:protein kinase [Enhygromyxa sp.]